MSIGLLDVNVLVAMFDPEHVSHDAAHHWFGTNQQHGWATCPITLNGCVRVLSRPTYPDVKITPAEVLQSLREFCASPHHHFWKDSISLVDETLFRSSMIAGPQTITDVYLLGLAVKNHGRLVTFDRGISLKAVHGAMSAHIVTL